MNIIFLYDIINKILKGIKRVMSNLFNTDIFKRLKEDQDFLAMDKKSIKAVLFEKVFSVKDLSEFKESVDVKANHINDFYSIKYLISYGYEKYYQGSNAYNNSQKRKEIFNLSLGSLWLLNTQHLKKEEQIDGYLYLLEKGYKPNKKFVLEEEIYENDLMFVLCKWSNENIPNLSSEIVSKLSHILIEWLIINEFDTLKASYTKLLNNFDRPTVSDVDKEQFAKNKTIWNKIKKYTIEQIEANGLKKLIDHHEKAGVKLL